MEAGSPAAARELAGDPTGLLTLALRAAGFSPAPGGDAGPGGSPLGRNLGSPDGSVRVLLVEVRPDLAVVRTCRTARRDQASSRLVFADL